MKKWLTLLLAFGLTSTVFVQAQTAGSSVSKKDRSSEKGIEKVFRGLAEVWNTGDVKAVDSFFTHDATLINPMGESGQDRAGVLKVITDDLTGPLKGTQQSFSDFNFVFVLSNLALVDATATLTGPDGSTAAPTTFHFYGMLVKRAKVWQIRSARIYAFSQPATAPTAMVAATDDSAPPEIGTVTPSEEKVSATPVK
ncbi:MAG: nuclear transport factor 2 family protein [bacterium]